MTREQIKLQLHRFENELQCAQMIDNTARRNQRVAFFRECIDETKRQLAELDALEPADGS